MKEKISGYDIGDGGSHRKAETDIVVKDEIEVIEITDCRYPELLRHLEKDAPARLYCIGDTSILSERCVAVVGARKATQYGKKVAYNIGRKLAECGIVTVSGMAYGCDSQAHTGALDGNGKTIAVLGCGVDICYPPKNLWLMDKIKESGLIISEYPPGMPPLTHHFPRRNRIISGISEMTVVAEASLSSGSLITAGCAAEQGRRVMAVPGNITNIMSIGCNKIIQDGAFPVVRFEDITDELGVSIKSEVLAEEISLGSDEKKIFEYIMYSGETTVDNIALKLEMKVPQVNAVVSILEIKGLVLSDMGKIYIAK